MSIFSEIVDAIFGGQDDKATTGEIVGGTLRIAAPFINALVTKPNKPKFPTLPDSVKNDPRVQQLFGPYGGGTNAPITEDLSPFQVAFPSMMNSLIQLTNKFDTPAKQAEAIETAVTKSPEVAVTKSPEATVTNEVTEEALDLPKVIDNYIPLIEEIATKEGVDPKLLTSIVATESSGNPDAVRVEPDGRKSIGLGQLLTTTASELAGRKVTDTELKDPATNLTLAAKYLKQLSDRFDNDYEKVIRSYNAGPGGVISGRVYNPNWKHYEGNNKHYRRTAAYLKRLRDASGS